MPHQVGAFGSGSRPAGDTPQDRRESVQPRRVRRIETVVRGRGRGRRRRTFESRRSGRVRRAEGPTRRASSRTVERHVREDSGRIASDSAGGVSWERRPPRRTRRLVPRDHGGHNGEDEGVVRRDESGSAGRTVHDALQGGSGEDRRERRGEGRARRREDDVRQHCGHAHQLQQHPQAAHRGFAGRRQRQPLGRGVEEGRVVESRQDHCRGRQISPHGRTQPLGRSLSNVQSGPRFIPRDEGAGGARRTRLREQAMEFHRIEAGDVLGYHRG
mmetsp:Transcript_52291/g.156937  ORF Transcript_52291/g.156937 Transcript_52291/m.156937 type:complete len:272 (-) Transcript_52291:1143-1958(-)